MDPRPWLAAGLALLLVGCQAPVSAPPTPAPIGPTTAPAALALSPAAATPAPPPALSPAATPTPAPPRATTSAAPVSPVVPTAPSVTATRVETLNAANAAFKAGNLKDAAGLYDRVVNTPPGSAEDAAATTAIDDFAWFRGTIALLADGREDEARAALEALKQRDPSSPLTRLADQLYNQYGMVGQLGGACAQLQPQVATQAGPVLATLGGLGVTNVDAATLCTVPAS